jgi:hypothetical protein
VVAVTGMNVQRIGLINAQTGQYDLAVAETLFPKENSQT